MEAGEEKGMGENNEQEVRLDDGWAWLTSQGGYIGHTVELV
jgi:hypothetical protein